MTPTTPAAAVHYDPSDVDIDNDPHGRTPVVCCGPQSRHGADPVPPGAER